MENNDKRKNKILKIIHKCKLNVTFFNNELNNFIKEEKIEINKINNKNFDILIEILNIIVESRIEDYYNYYKIIDFVIKKFKYKTLNYTIGNGNNYEVPLFLVIFKGHFKIADFLIERGANINYLARPTTNKESSIIHYIKEKYNKNHQNVFNTRKIKTTISNKTFNYIFKNGYYIENNIQSFIYDLLIVFNYDHLETLLENYIFGNNFILSLLSFYKNKIYISKNSFNEIIEKERTKLKFDNNIYKVAAHKYNSHLIEILLNYDGDKPDEIFNKIVENNVLYYAVENCNNALIKRILTLPSLDINKIDIKKILNSLCYFSLNEYDSSLDYLCRLLRNKLHNNNSLDLILKEIILIRGKCYEYAHVEDRILNFYMQQLYESIVNTIEYSPSSSTLPYSLELLNNDFYSKALLSILNLAIKVNNFELVKDLLERNSLKSFIDVYAKDENDIIPIVNALDSYDIRNSLPFEGSITNTGIIKHVFNYGNYGCHYYDEFSDDSNNDDIKRKYDIDINIFFKAIINKNYPVFKFILYETDIIEIIKFKDVDHPLQPLYALRPSMLRKMANYVGISEEDARTTNIFSNHKFTQQYKNYIKDFIFDNDISIFRSLFKAVYFDSINNVKFYLSQIQNKTSFINKMCTGFTPTTMAYLFQRMEIFKYLLKYNKNYINDGFGYSIFYYIIIKDDVEILKQIIHTIQQTIITDYLYNKIVKLAIKCGSKFTLSYLLMEYNTYVHDGNEKINKFQLKVIVSNQFSVEDKKNILQLLFQIGGNINYIDEDMDSLLKLAENLKEDSLSLVKFLIKNGANIERCYGNNGEIILNLVLREKLSLVEYLLSLNLNLNINYIYVGLYDEVDEHSPLSVAIEKNSLDLVKILIHHGADINQILQDEEGNRKSLLVYALEHGHSHKDIVKYLMELQAHIKFYDKNDGYKIIKILSDESINLSYYLKSNPLHSRINDSEMIKNIIIDGRLDLLKILMNYQFLDVNTLDEQGETPLFYAIKLNDRRIINYLLQCGSNIKIKNIHGETVRSLNKRYHSFYNHHSYRSKRIKLEE